jgi:hypothetical protein
MTINADAPCWLPLVRQQHCVEVDPVDFAPASAADENAAGDWAPLPDASALPILALSTNADTALGRSLRQVIRSLDDPNGVISAFDSFASGR